MEFMNRGAMPPAAARMSSNGVGAPPASSKKSRWKGGPLWLRVVWVVLLFSVTVVVLALAVFLYFGGPSEAKLIDKSKHQAVFLTNGQVYFGKINSVNSKYLDLRGIYYLNVNRPVQPNQQEEGAEEQNQNQITLVKLGCSELHGPIDQMVINRDQITYWENLKDNGQVSQAINKWLSQDLDSDKCRRADS